MLPASKAATHCDKAHKNCKMLMRIRARIERRGREGYRETREERRRVIDQRREMNDWREREMMWAGQVDASQFRKFVLTFQLHLDAFICVLNVEKTWQSCVTSALQLCVNLDALGFV